MRLPGRPDIHLTYCTNIHPAEGWAAVRANVERFAPALKARFSPDAPFGIGLRLSARDARELNQGNNLAAFRTYLDDNGLYVAILNGFPYGPFHGTPVKASVYAPDWRDPERARYTVELFDILSALLPDDVDGGVSTAPLSYKSWMLHAGAGDWDAIIGNIVNVAGRLARLEADRGVLLHLDIEPEPDCSIENTDETLDFFENRLLPSGAPRLAHALGIPEDDARERLLEHIRVCFDCCHFAVEFEDAVGALDRLTHAGIRIGRAQLSSALDVRLPADPAEAARATERLQAFADTTYLHQVVARRDGSLARYPDLPDALQHGERAADAHWRVHFHVPLFTAEYGLLGSTQPYVATAIRRLLETGVTGHLEIETYTWDVLPPALKMDLLDSIAREYEWVLAQCR